jgi:hypothetical protein
VIFAALTAIAINAEGWRVASPSRSPISVRAVRRVFLAAGPQERQVRADAAGSLNLTDNEAVRLIHREQPHEDSLEEAECYDHSYGEHMFDHVEVVRLEPAGIRIEIPVKVETEHHVTTERLKSQFEERLAARARSSRRPRP